MERYTFKNGKKLRMGYTTGACAAGAAKCAAIMLISGDIPEFVTIDTPAGISLELKISDSVLTKNYAECSIIKDAGDDPDITDGIKIFARVEFIDEDIVEITGGAGIGVVTKKGLLVQPDCYAINPGPMNMIRSEVENVRIMGKGLRITVSAPEGVLLAEKTFNPKLGIRDGISILGTTGIVEPLSSDAVRESLALELSMMKESGIDSVVFVPGRYGKDFAMSSCRIPEEMIISIGNHAGYMLEQGEFYGMKNILLIGHTGKLVKLAGGNFDMHSRVSDSRFEIIAANYILLGGTPETAVKIMNCVTTEEALEYIDIENFYNHICGKIRDRCLSYLRGRINIEVITFSMERGLLASTPGADELMKSIRSSL